MPMTKTAPRDGIVISALRARSSFGKLLNRVDKESRSLVIENGHSASDPAEHPGLCPACRSYEPEVHCRSHRRRIQAQGHRVPFFAPD